MTYTIKSNRIGAIGTEFVPDENTNIEALLANGFIESDEPSDSPTPKPAKTKEPAKKD